MEEGAVRKSRRTATQGTHANLSSKRRVKEGSHNFLNSAFQKQTQNNLVKQGKHHWQNKEKQHCYYCGLDVDAGNYKQWHGENCVIKTGIKVTVAKIKCPHCGLVGGNTIMKRY